MDNENPKSPEEKPLRVAVLHLEYNLDTFMLTIAGAVPTHELALDMARRLVDECEFTVSQARAEARGPRLVDPSNKWPARYGRN